MKFHSTLTKYWYVVLSVLISLCIIPFFFENIGRSLFILILLTIWCILGILFKNFTLSSFLSLLFVLPFNITYQIPQYLFGIQIYDPYVNGIIINYLVPTLSVLDLVVFLLLLSMFFEKRLLFQWKGFSFLKIFCVFTLYLVIQNCIVGEFLSVLNSLRCILYIFTFYQLLQNIKDILNLKVYRYILIGGILLVLLQGVFALIQFSGGTSLGISFLGESNVVSGMMGSSFLNLNGTLYLRGYGTFPHPNIFAGWLILNIFLGWYLFENMLGKQVYPIILMVISSLVLSLTFSRIGLLVCGMIWLVFLFKYLFKLNLHRRQFSFVGLLSERVLNLLTGNDTSWSDRVDLMRSAWGMIKQNLLVGVGMGRFVGNMGENIPRTSNGLLLLQPVHNIFLLCLSELGIVGMSLWCTLLYFFLRKRIFNTRCITLLVCIVIISMFDHYLFTLPQGIVIMFLLILI